MSTKVIGAFLCLLVSLLFLCPDKAKASDTRIQVVERPENEFLILGAMINGIEREAGITAYLSEGKSHEHVLVPLGAICAALSYNIEVNIADGLAEGWFIDEANRFQLDIRNATAYVKNKKIALEPEAAEVHIDDIYVSARNMEAWFGIRVTLDMNALLLVIDSDRALPFEEKIKRMKNAKSLLGKGSAPEDYSKDAYFVPYEMYGYPTLVLGENLNVSKSASGVDIHNVTNFQSFMDFMKMESSFNLSHRVEIGEEQAITSARLNFKRRDPSLSLLGPLKAGKIEAGDISFPSVPLLVGSQSGAGVLVSSDPELGFKYSSNSENYVLDGDAPVGWDAELYRNGHYEDFQQIGDDGRFLFDDLDLTGGYNLFTVILYGPEGQKKTVTREVFKGPTMLEKGEVSYDFALGMPEADFVPLAENAQDNFSPGASGQVFYGVSNFLTVGGSVYNGPQEEKDSSGATFSAVTSIWGMNFQGQVMAADNSRRAFEVAARARPLGVNLSVSHIRYKNFEEEDQDVLEETSGSVSRNIGPVSVAFQAKKKSFIDEEDEIRLENNISASLLGTKFTNQLTKTYTPSRSRDDLDGEFSALKTVHGIRFRGNIIYDLSSDAPEKLVSASLAAQKNFSDKSSLRVNASYTFASQMTNTDFRYSKNLGAFSLDLTGSADTENNYSMGIGVRTALQPSNIGGKYAFINPEKGYQSTLGVRPYLDKNDNDQFDSEIDEPIQDIEFSASTGNVKAKSGEDGVAWMQGMIETPTRVSINQESISSIYMIPKKSKYNVIPRQGSSSIMDVPFKELGEIDGFVFDKSAGGGKPLPSVPVRLIDAASGKQIAEMDSEYDGYYVFSALPLGQYKVIASSGWFDESEKEGAVSGAAERLIELTSEQPTQLEIKLEVDPEEIPKIKGDAVLSGPDLGILEFPVDNGEIIPAPLMPEDLEPEAASSDTLESKEAALHEKQTLNVRREIYIHIGSLSTEAQATEEWDRMKNRYASVLKNYEKVTKSTLIDNTEFFRLYAGPMSQADSDQVCAELMALNAPGGCIRVDSSVIE